MQAAEVVALVPAPSELVVERLAPEAGRLVVVAAARQMEAACPACGTASRRVHGRYTRHLADLPWHGLAVALDVRVRRFVCAVPRCPRRICRERLPGTTAAYARRTSRLRSALELISLALGGAAGSRLARELGMAAGASADTLPGVLGTVRDWVHVHLRGRQPWVPDAATPRQAHRSARRAAWLMTTAPEALHDAERAYVAAICTACPTLATVRAAAADFGGTRMRCWRPCTSDGAPVRSGGRSTA